MFNNAHHALRWAYTTINRPIVKMSAINHMRQGSRGAQNMLLYDLNAQDRHGQAALIIGMVARLPDLAEREYIEAEFGRRVMRDDVRELVYQGSEALLLGFGLGGENAGEFVYRVMYGYFSGVDMSHKAIRRILSCQHGYAFMVRNCLYDILDVIHDRAMADMTEAFERQGLIEREYA